MTHCKLSVWSPVVVSGWSWVVLPSFCPRHPFCFCICFCGEGGSVCVCVSSHVLLPSCALSCHLLQCALCLPYASAFCHPLSLCHQPSTPHCLRSMALCGPVWFYLLFVPDTPFAFASVSARRGECVRFGFADEGAFLAPALHTRLWWWWKQEVMGCI